jgi:uncharacterized membrane protein
MMGIFVLRFGLRYGHRGGWGWWILMIPLALVVIGAIVELTKMAMASRERKALIESGVNPDTVVKKAPTLR